MCLAVPGKILTIHSGNKADIDFGGVIRSAQMDLVPDAVPGDFVIVHAGFAIQRIDEKSARETLALFQEIQDLSRG